MAINPTSFSPFSTFGAGMSSDVSSTATGTASSASPSATASAAGTTATGGVDQTSNSSSSSLDGLSTNDFMQLFLAQLQNQDPTPPVDDSQMLSQLSQMSEISTLQGVQSALQGSQLAQSAAFIGKSVTGVDVNGAAVNGVVTSVTQSSDAGLVLQVGSQYISPSSVTTVTNPTTTGS
jgi:flagellar basal-body rod modification protein FlgD